MVETAKRFFLWAIEEYPTEYKSITPRWIKKMRVGNVEDLSGKNEFVSLDDVLTLVRLPFDENNLARRRDRAATAFLYLVCMRCIFRPMQLNLFCLRITKFVNGLFTG